jgi:hypothetical protein
MQQSNTNGEISPSKTNSQLNQEYKNTSDGEITYSLKNLSHIMNNKVDSSLCKTVICDNKFMQFYEQKLKISPKKINPFL